MTTTTRITSCPLDLGNSTIKFRLISSHTALGIGNGCNKPAGEEVRYFFGKYKPAGEEVRYLLLWQIWHAATKCL